MPYADVFNKLWIIGHDTELALPVQLLFDDTLTTTDKLTEATKAAGYPSSIRR